MRHLITYVGLFLGSTFTAANEEFAQHLFNTWQAKQFKPHFSKSVANPSLASAYAAQFRYVRKRLATEKIVGFKAGLTSTAGQKKFAVSQALSGVLLSSGMHTQDRPLFLSDYGKLMIETEIGFRVSRPILQPVKSISELKTFFKSALPVIELPDLGFQHPEEISGVDIVAANVAANSFIFGVETPLIHLPNLNQLTISLSIDKQEIYQGSGSDALNDQWQVLFWLVNQLIEEGYQIQPDQVLITGALGKMLPAKPGRYFANFGALGNMQFIVK